MNKNIFVTATDTEVGKTFVSSILINKLLSKKINTAYIKPYETGLGKKFRSIDYNFVKNVNPQLKINENTSVIEKFIYPLSPRDSAKLENRKSDIENTILKIKKIISEYEVSIIEGAGGILVPITDNYNIIDLIKDINIECIVVGRCGLGTINHTCLTINYLKQNNVKVNSFILNGKNFKAAEQNKENIERMTGIKCSGIIPYINRITQKNINNIEINTNLIFK